MSLKISFLKSGVLSKDPLLTDLGLGEIAINYNDQSPGLYFRVSDGIPANDSIVKLSPQGQIAAVNLDGLVRIWDGLTASTIIHEVVNAPTFLAYKTATDASLTTISGDIATLTTQVTGLETDTTQLLNNYVSLRNDLDVNTAATTQLGVDIAAINTLGTSVQTDITNINNLLAGQRVDINNNAADINQNNIDITGVTARVSDNEVDIAALQAAVVGGGPLVHALNDLNDVTTTGGTHTPLDGEVLTWDNALSQWVPKTGLNPLVTAANNPAGDSTDDASVVTPAWVQNSVAADIATLDTALRAVITAGDTANTTQITNVQATLQANIDSQTLVDLDDTNIASPPGSDEVLTYDIGSGKWINKAIPSPARALEGLTNVNNAADLNGDALLRYDSGAATPEWNSVVPTFTVTPTATDITATNPALEDLVIPAAVTGSAGLLSSADKATIDGLGTAASTDAADYATAAQGTNADSALQNLTGSNLGELFDVDTTSASINQVLQYDGTEWKPGTVSAGGGGTVTTVTGTGPVTITNPTTTPEITINAATDSAAGIVQLADAAAITAGTAGRIVDAAQLQSAVTSIGLNNLTDVTITPPTPGTKQFLISDGAGGWVNTSIASLPALP
jgi:uncharacterized protein YoxC